MIDHLVYATPDVDATVEWVAGRLGVRPTPGGKHPGLGTRNALLAIGDGAYLEIIGVDGDHGSSPDGPARGPSAQRVAGSDRFRVPVATCCGSGPQAGRPFGLDGITEARLTAWAAQAAGIDERAEQSRRAGYDPGPVRSMSRQRPDGVELHWRLTSPGAEGIELVPFLIEWADRRAHPSATSAQGCRLVSFAGEHPDPVVVSSMLAALGVDLTIGWADHPRLVAVLEGPAGTVELR